MDKIERAIELGVLKRGWRYVDYCLDAIPRYAWIDCVISGEKGSGKSNFLLQSGYKLFHGFDSFEEIDGNKRGIITDYSDVKAWRLVLDHLVFRPRDFAILLQRVMKEKRRLSIILADDFNLHWPRSLYSTNRRLWEQFQRNWEAFRAQLSIFECTVPRKDTVISVILKDINYDVLVSNRQKVEVFRWYYDLSFFHPDKVVKLRIDLENEDLVLENVPSEIWREYWNRKQELVDEETSNFQKLLTQMEVKPGDEPSNFLCPKCNKVMDNPHNFNLHVAGCRGVETLISKPKRRRG